jgi:hypothetical protein
LGVINNNSLSTGPTANNYPINNYFPGLSSNSKNFKNNAIIIFISTRPKCCPIQFLEPPENGKKIKGSSNFNVSHLPGRNSKGFAKILGFILNYINQNSFIFYY